MRGKRRELTPDQEAEIVELYEKTTTPVMEIRDTYGVDPSRLYRILDAHGVVLRTRRTSVTVDATQTVVTATRAIEKATGSRWLVRFTGEVEVRAESVDQALAEARRLGVVRRVYSVRMLGEET